MRENEGGVDMALIKCPECGKEISDAAESCPNCGYPIKGQQALALGMLKVAVESLTDTQREILLSLVNGSRSSDVIEKLCISSATYYRQVRTIKQIIRGEKKDV